MGSRNSKSEPRSGSPLQCGTTVGPLSIQTFGPEKGPVILALHGMASADFVIREWDDLAERLASSGFRVLLPNLHSNPAVAPTLLGTPQLNPILLQIQQHFSPDRPIALMGKSWGGAVAVEFAAAHPAIVKQLVLACPAVTALRRKTAMVRELKMPVLLLWAKDDWVTWFSCSQVYCDNCSQISLKAAERGGHRILPEYTDCVLEFLV